MVFLLGDGDALPGGLLMDILQVPQQGSPIGLIIIGVGVFIVWLAWRRKRGVGTGAPMVFIPLPGHRGGEAPIP